MAISTEVLASQNPWWEDPVGIEKDEKIREAFSRKHRTEYEFEKGNFLIIGPRQVGKTTFMKLLIHKLIKDKINSKNILFFSCEALREKDDIISLIQLFDRFSQGQKYIFLDEITFVKDWDVAIKFILDNLAKDKFIYISGSSIATFKGERFPGRDIVIREFLPLKFREFCFLFGSDNLKENLRKIELADFNSERIFESCLKTLPFFKEIQILFERYLECGGFLLPAFQLIEEGEIMDKTFEVYKNWILGDLSKLERSERIFSSVTQGVIKSYGTRFSLSSIAREMEIGSHVTVRKYLELMENLFLIRSYFNTRLDKKMLLFRKERKVYFSDPFLFRVFNWYVFGSKRISDERLPSLIEGVVGEHLKRKFGQKVFYFSNRKEVDFIVENLGIEIKIGKVGGRDFPKIEIRNKVLLSKDSMEDFGIGRVKVVPISSFLLIV